jgi:hypothetical protein
MTNTLTTIQLEASVEYQKHIKGLTRATDYLQKSYEAMKLFSHYEEKFQNYDRDEDMGKAWTWLETKAQVREKSVSAFLEYQHCKEMYQEILKGLV